MVCKQYSVTDRDLTFDDLQQGALVEGHSIPSSGYSDNRQVPRAL